MIAGAIVGGIVAVLLLVLAAFPWGLLRGIVEREANERFGRPVTIGAVDRVDHIGFHPVIAIRDVRVAQADWAGTGDFARIRSVTVRFAALSLLHGDFKPEGIVADGVRLALVRAADGRTNWQRPGKPEQGGGSTELSDLRVTDAVVSYRDAKQDRQATVAIAADPVAGFRASGRGTIRGAPVTIAVSGPAIAAAGPWPFSAAITGKALDMRAKGTMDRPLDTNAMTLDLTARADDLKLIDAVIEAGLFHTQPLRLTAQVRHDRPRWAVQRLDGTIGRSRLAGELTVDKVDGRSKLKGAIRSTQLDFNDFASDAQLAAAAALAARIGPRLIPNTRVDISKIATTDGTIDFRIDRILSSGPTPSIIRAISGTLTMDHRLLTIAPFRMELPPGTVTGRGVVDQRGGPPRPTMTIDLTMVGRRETQLPTAGGPLRAVLSGHARLTGVGETIRSAIGRSRGTIGLVADDGTLPERYAAALGFDAGRALLAGKQGQTGLRCLIVRLAVKDGVGRAAPFLIDTTQSQMRGQGTVDFPSETINLSLTGAPKRDAVLRIPGSAKLVGRIQQPELVVPPQVKSVGNIFKAIGRKISGHEGPLATDADCAALRRLAMR